MLVSLSLLRLAQRGLRIHSLKDQGGGLTRRSTAPSAKHITKVHVTYEQYTTTSINEWPAAAAVGQTSPTPCLGDVESNY
jgi:hypothetical protein